jgi:hypothetical protein
MVRLFTVSTRSGSQSFQSPYTDAEACDKLAELVQDGKCKGEFAESLAEKALGCSHRQMAWVHKLVVDNEQNPASTTTTEQAKLGRIMLLFMSARMSKIIWPCVRVVMDNYPPLRLTMAGPNARFPDSINITGPDKVDGRRPWYGRIHKNGAAELKNAPDGTVEVLRIFNKDPVAYATDYGRKTGYCCFCGHILETAESISVGYGPICAEKYGLPWGEIDRSLFNV